MHFRLPTLMILMAVGPALLAALYCAFVVNRDVAGAIEILVSTVAMAAMAIAPPL